MDSFNIEISFVLYYNNIHQMNLKTKNKTEDLKMTNQQIINEYLENNGLIDEATGFPMVELHTYAAWKKAGYQVKKGEKSIHHIVIWKRTSKKVKDEETGEEKDKTSMFMTRAAFFTAAQVEKMALA